MRHTIVPSSALVVLLLSGCVTARNAAATAGQRDVPTPVSVTLDPACVRNIGGVSRFRREQFITIHASPMERDLSDEERDFLVKELEVSYGREGGTRTWWRQQTPADPKRPDFPDVAYLRRGGAEARKTRQRDPRYDPAHWREMILCTHPETFYARPGNTSAAWGPRTVEGAAEFTANYLKAFWDDADRLRYLEVFNEPMIKLKKIGGTPADVARQHVAVARRVRQICPGVLIGGYTAAYPEVELRDFDHWKRWMKTFMDIAGREMDFFSTHIYDGVNVEGTPRQRTGSNAEAILDIIDAYSHIAFGVAKPQIISEFGLIPKHTKTNQGRPYTPECAGRMAHATIAQLMTFMDHPDRLIKVVPFFLTKGGWTYSLPGCSEETPYPFLLWRRRGGGHVLTDLALFYRFWKGVSGQWRRSSASDPDVRCHLLVDGKRLFLILCNLEDTPRTVVLDGLANLPADRIVLRRLTTHGGAPRLTETPKTHIARTLELAIGESAMLIMDSSALITPVRQIREHRCYATTYLQDIEANTPIRFRFSGVPTGEGTAVLRLGIGREQGKSLKPVVRMAGQQLPVPDDWAGGDQSGRRSFFGMIEVAVPMGLLSAAPSVEMTFPDSGGKVASAVLQVNRLDAAPAAKTK